MQNNRLSQLKLIKRNRLWLASKLPLSEKLSYYISLPTCYFRALTTGRKEIRYLGTNFQFDNFVTPLTLQLFPNEIEKKVALPISKKIRSVLDIGANIGQFAVTLKRLSNPAVIDSFEPNPKVFPLLENNIRNLRGVNAYNYGLGGKGNGEMFFEKGRSSVGSLIKENAGTKKKLEKVDINLLNNPARVTGRKFYDLIKIDVEGFEYEVLESLRGVSCKYMFIELSGPGREKSHQHSELFAIVAQKFGSFNILHLTQPENDGATLEVLLGFVK